MADVSIRLGLIDGATRGFARLEQQVKVIRQHMIDEAKRAAEEEVRAAEQANARIRQNFSRFEQQTRAIQERVAADARRAAEERVQAELRVIQRISEARDRLNLRSHNQVRDDIAHVRAAYQTLSSTASLSWREQVQAADRMRTSIRNLTNEMGHLTAAQRAYGAAQVGAGVVGGVGGGIAGAAYAMRTPLANALTFDQRIGYLTNTAYPERDVRGKTIGAKELETAVHNAVKVSGGEVNGITSLLEEMVSGGRMSLSDILQSLPYLAKTAVANNANPQDVGKLANTLYGQGFVTNVDELKKANNAIVAVGQKSSFEYKNQVMHLPSQLPYAKTAGMSGLKAVRDVAVLNGTSSLVMGTADEAGVATHNFLMKMSSQDTAKDFEKAGRGDLHEALMKARAKGMSALEFWQQVIEQEIKENPKLKMYKAKLDKAKNPQEAKAILGDIEMIAKGSSISRYFQEMRGQTGALGYQNAPYRKILEDTANAALRGTFTPNEGNFAYISQTSPYKISAAGQTVDAAEKHILDNITPRLSKVADSFMSLAERYPLLADTAAVAPWVAGGAIGAVGGSMMLRRLIPAAAGAAETVAGGSLAASTTALLTRSTLAFNGAMSNTTAFFSRLPAISRAATAYAAPYFPLMARATGAGAAAYTGYQAGGFINDGISKALSALAGHETNLGSAIYDLMNYTPPPVEIKPIDVNTKTDITIGLAPGFVVTGQKSTTASNAAGGSNTATVKTGNMWKDVP